MDPKSMENAMLKNMVEKTGKSIDDWSYIIKKQNFLKRKEIVNFLKEKHSVGHFYAHLIVKKIIT